MTKNMDKEKAFDSMLLHIELTLDTVWDGNSTEFVLEEEKPS